MRQWIRSRGPGFRRAYWIRSNCSDETSSGAAVASVWRPIEIEDKDLFPLAARVLTEDALAEVGREMAKRRGAILKV
jgi:hypothetical protein